MTSVRHLRAALARTAGFFLRARREREMAAEFESHLQLHIDDGIRRGLSPQQARREALARFGPVEAIKDSYRDRGGLPFVDILLQDLKNGVRVLRRYPGVSATAVLTLAVGVGANTAMLSLVDALVFRPPAGVSEPARLVSVPQARNYVLFRELSSRSNVLELAAQSGVHRLSLGLGADAEPLAAMCVTAGYFQALGARTVIGRSFQSGEDAPGHPRLVVLSHGFWQRRFGGQHAVLGRSLPIGGLSHEVVGVAQPGFTGVDSPAVDAWILLPLAPEACSFTGTNLLASTRGSWLRTLGRVRDGHTLAAAEAEVAALIQEEGRSAARLEPVSALSLSRDKRLALWMAAGAGLVLLIACANVAGLLSVRAIERHREMAVRLQLGASRRRVFTQLVVENLVLAVLCAAAAAAVARVAIGLFPPFFPQLGERDVLIATSWWLLAAFAIAAAALSALLPAVQAARTQTAAHFRDHHSAGGRSVVRTGLLVGQMATAIVLVVAAGLFARSVAAARADLGFDLDHVVVATVDLQKAGIRRQAEIRATFDAMLQRVRGLPDVEAAALTSMPPLGSARSAIVMPSMPGQATRVVNYVSPGYFATMGTRILRGRGFTASDDESGAPVMVVDEAFAAERWPGEDPIGKCGRETSAGACIEVVGVAERRRHRSLTESDAELFHPLAQEATYDGIPQAVLVRMRPGASRGVATVSKAIQGASERLPFVTVRPLEDLANTQARSWRLGAAVFGMFGAVALGLAAIGIYATLAFWVRQRTREIGVRMALGADGRAVLRMVLGSGLWLALTACALGTAGAFALARYLRSLLFNVEPGDPLTFAAASVVLILAALAGCIVPAVRASRVDASVALRYE